MTAIDFGNTMPGDWNIYCEADIQFLAGVSNELAGIGQSSSGERDQDGNLISKVLYWQRSVEQSYDPLYREPTDRNVVWHGPYRIRALVEFEDADGRYDVSAEDGGVERTYDGIMVITVANWLSDVVEKADPGLSGPRENDVIDIFDGFRFFELERVERSGYVLNSNKHVEWKCWLRKRDSFEPARNLPETP